MWYALFYESMVCVINITTKKNRFRVHTKNASYARFVPQAFVVAAIQVVLRHVVVARQTVAWYKQIQGKYRGCTKINNKIRPQMLSGSGLVRVFYTITKHVFVFK